MSAWTEPEPRDELVLTLATLGGIVVGVAFAAGAAAAAYLRWRWAA